MASKGEACAADGHGAAIAALAVVKKWRRERARIREAMIDRIVGIGRIQDL